MEKNGKKKIMALNSKKIGSEIALGKDDNKVYVLVFPNSPQWIQVAGPDQKEWVFTNIGDGGWAVRNRLAFKLQ